MFIYLCKNLLPYKEHHYLNYKDIYINKNILRGRGDLTDVSASQCLVQFTEPEECNPSAYWRLRTAFFYVSLFTPHQINRRVVFFDIFLSFFMNLVHISIATEHNGAIRMHSATWQLARNFVCENYRVFLWLSFSRQSPSYCTM